MLMEVQKLQLSAAAKASERVYKMLSLDTERPQTLCPPVDAPVMSG